VICNKLFTTTEMTDRLKTMLQILSLGACAAFVLWPLSSRSVPCKVLVHCVKPGAIFNLLCMFIACHCSESTFCKFSSVPSNKLFAQLITILRFIRL